MLKKLWTKGKCLVGAHEGAWQYRESTTCAQFRLCKQCGVRSERIEHSWAAWMITQDGSCEHTRSCSRCSESERRVEHIWGPSQYESAGSCTQLSTCTRCQERASKGARHLWGTWEYASSEGCRQHQLCERCGARGSNTQVVHHWGEWQAATQAIGSIRICRRCGELESRLAVSPMEAPMAVKKATPAAHVQFAPTDRSRPTSTTIDPRLVAHWRRTEVNGSSSIGGVTDRHLVLGADGRFARFSRTSNRFGNRNSAREAGSWVAANGSMRFTGDHGDTSECQYQLHEIGLVFSGEGHLGPWRRA